MQATAWVASISIKKPLHEKTCFLHNMQNKDADELHVNHAANWGPCFSAT